ncbi:MAG: class I tRNA ligase family protein, partial [Mycoplasmataceae bacterium]|nr:class I tRNA ligase family protein [Mycoplasmataceae bacterium]
SYPHDWRTHKPIVFRGTPQWFVSIKTIKKDIMDKLSKVPSYPEWGTKRLLKMIDGRDEWTISRQRTWGVPIIAFYDKDGEVVANAETFDYVINLVKEHGTDVWWEKETDELLPESYRGKGFTREMNIMDVWFDSGSSHIWMEELYGVDQADVYIEGSDQYRGWFNSSLVNSIAYRGKTPYKQLISHGFVLDGKNQKMSKSKGNVIDPLKIVSKQGADILRLWVANSEYTSDITISDDIMKQTSDMYRKIRNTLRFMLGNISDYKVEDKVELKGIHAYINEKLGNLMFSVLKNYNEYKFSAVVKEINIFLVEMSGFYFDFAKDILYCDDANDIERRSIQTNMWNASNFIIKALAPILPTSMEDAYSNLPKLKKKESVHLETLKMSEGCEMHKHQTDWELFFTLKDEVYKALEEAKASKVIKRANEASVTIDNKYKELEKQDLRRMFMVGKVQFGAKTSVTTFESTKCVRCWNHFEKLNTDSICDRCEKVTK